MPFYDENDLHLTTIAKYQGKGIMYFVFWQKNLWTIIALAAFDIHVLAVSIESQIAYSFIINLSIGTHSFLFLIFFWLHCMLILQKSFDWKNIL